MADTDPKALDAPTPEELTLLDIIAQGGTPTNGESNYAWWLTESLRRRGVSLVPTATLDALRGKLDLPEGVAMEFARQVDEQKQKVRTREAGWGEDGYPLPFVNAERKQEMYEELVASGLSRPEAMANVWPALAALPAEQPATPETTEALTCPFCSCRLGTDDADPNDCGCGGPCNYITWGEFITAMVSDPDEARRLLDLWDDVPFPSGSRASLCAATGCPWPKPHRHGWDGSVHGEIALTAATPETEAGS